MVLPLFAVWKMLAGTMCYLPKIRCMPLGKMVNVPETKRLKSWLPGIHSLVLTHACRVNPVGLGNHFWAEEILDVLQRR